MSQRKEKGNDMKKIFTAFLIVVGLLCMSNFVYAANDYGTNMARIILGADNYGTDPNGAYDITGAKDNWISNDTSGVWVISATRARVTGNLYTDSLLGDFVVAEDSARIYKDAFAKWVPQVINSTAGAGSYNAQIQCGAKTGVGKGLDTITYHVAYAVDPIVVITPQISCGVDTAVVAQIDSIGLTKAYFHNVIISYGKAGGMDTTYVQEVSDKVIINNWISIGK